MGRDNLEDMKHGLKERLTLKYILKKRVGKLWNEFTQEPAIIALKKEYAGLCVS
jgi:hypothetical protein